MVVLRPGAKISGEKGVQEVDPGKAQQDRKPRPDQPQDAKHAHLARVTIQFILKAGRRDSRRR